MYSSQTGGGTAVVNLHGGFNSPPANERNSVHGGNLTLSGDGDNGIQQHVTSLTPNTRYSFSGYAKHAKEVNVEFSVQASNRVVVTKASRDVTLDEGQTWRFTHGQFENGPNDTAAVIAILKRGKGVAYVDDTGIVPAHYGMQEE